MERPAHHREKGGYRNPRPDVALDAHPRMEMLFWLRDRLAGRLPPNPGPAELPVREPRPARPRAAGDELRVTWIGHASFLLQLGGLNVLTDPVWSRRASPVAWIGPRRFVPPPLRMEELPPIDAVVISHDHYDHLDDATVRALAARFGGELTWLAPLGHADWLEARGVARHVELDWWEATPLAREGTSATVRALPAQHWSGRMPFLRGRRLWASWSLELDGGPRVYFGGDSGYFPGYREIGRRCGPFELALLPIGAYSPRWFMRRSHMNPEEAVRAWEDLGGRGCLVPGHWGTFRLSEEDPLEPPRRLRNAWEEQARPGGGLRVLRHGETLRIPVGGALPSAAEVIGGRRRGTTTSAAGPGRRTGATKGRVRPALG